MFELNIGLADDGEFTFNKSFMQFKIKKRSIWEVLL